MTDVILVINAGSTSLKFGVYGAGADRKLPLLLGGGVDGMSTAPHFSAAAPDGKPIDSHDWGQGKAIDHKTALSFVVGWVEKHEAGMKVAAAGHRIVLGGERYAGPIAVTPDALDYLESLTRMEPSHQAYEVLGARALAEDFPGLPQVAVFDSSFHRTMPEVAQVYALPRELRDAGVRHWGYHGISYDYISRQIAQRAPRARRVIVGHLGGGASMCALLDGKSMETTMAFAGLTGLPMASRSGDVPADVIFYLIEQAGYAPKDLESLLYHKSGLLGLSGLSEDMKAIQDSKTPEAKLAFDYFIYAMQKYAGSYAAVLGGLDALVFTAGIGEHSAPVRAALCARLGWLGVKIDEKANTENAVMISTPESAVSVWVIPTNEDLMIARHTLDIALPA
ncbi:acetate/propionate family kinase [Methylocella sp.]|uniref:acetate/propionate family kinase n=1 Tax=Methylocella sp. TaxID=1978226 RepID=UPI003784D56E